MGVQAPLGMDAKLYRLSTGTRAAWPASGAPANLDEVGNVTDVTINLEKGEADVTTRGNNGWRARKSTLKDGTVEFEMIYDTTDTDFNAFQSAWLNNATIACAILDGASGTTGTQGLWADFEVMNFTKAEPLEDAQKVSVTLAPAYSSIAPEWVTVGS